MKLRTGIYCLQSMQSPLFVIGLWKRGRAEAGQPATYIASCGYRVAWFTLLWAGVLMGQEARLGSPIPSTLIARLGNACEVYQQREPVGSGANVEIRFGSSTWLLNVDNVGITGPWVRDVRFKGGDWKTSRTILKEAGLADIYVVYHGGAGVLDLTRSNRVAEIESADLPAVGGGLLTLMRKMGNSLESSPFPEVAVECRDRGIDWLCREHGTSERGRGYEVLLWSIVDSGNYDNIVQYILRDDGSIGFRLGTSGYLNTGPVVQPAEAHIHNGLWRLSTNLFDEQHNRVYMMEHSETGQLAADRRNLIAREQWVDWDPYKFTTLLVESLGLRNSLGHLMGYEIVPFDRKGTARHEEVWTQHDFLITREHPAENGLGASQPNDWRINHREPDVYLSLFANSESLDADMTPVIWYRSSVHHHPTDSDLDKAGNLGIVSAHWAGFDYRPHDAFAYNPMTGGLPSCGK